MRPERFTRFDSIVRCKAFEEKRTKNELKSTQTACDLGEGSWSRNNLDRHTFEPFATTLNQAHQIIIKMIPPRTESAFKVNPMIPKTLFLSFWKQLTTPSKLPITAKSIDPKIKIPTTCISVSSSMTPFSSMTPAVMVKINIEEPVRIEITNDPTPNPECFG